MKYLQPKSLTWWAGVLSIIIGALMLAKPQSAVLPELAQVLSALLGGYGASPASMIVLGFGLIGIRAKLEGLHNDR